MPGLQIILGKVLLAFRGKAVVSLIELVERARPDLPLPRCRVKLICGPPAAGKSTYVKANADPADVVVDLDMIARELGFGRYRPEDAAAELLTERNRRLAALADEPPGATAWVILSAPSPSLRRWWCRALNVRSDDVIVLVPSRWELHRRIENDPDRKSVQSLHRSLVEQWFERERANDPGILDGRVDDDGFPLDPLHPWNR